MCPCEARSSCPAPGSVCRQLLLGNEPPQSQPWALAVLCIRTRGEASAAAWDRRGRDRGRQLLAEELSCASLRNQSRFPGVSHDSSALGQVVRQCQ